MDISAFNRNIDLASEQMAIIRLRQNRTIAAAMTNTGKKVKELLKNSLLDGSITKYKPSDFTANATYVSPVDIDLSGTTVMYHMTIGLRPIANKYMKYAEFGGDEGPINGVSKNVILPANLEEETHVSKAQRELMGEIITKQRGRARSKKEAKRKRILPGLDEENSSRRKKSINSTTNNIKRINDNGRYRAHYFFGIVKNKEGNSEMGLFYTTSRNKAPQMVLRAKPIVHKTETSKYISTASRYTNEIAPDELSNAIVLAIQYSR